MRIKKRLFTTVVYESALSEVIETDVKRRRRRRRKRERMREGAELQTGDE